MDSGPWMAGLPTGDRWIPAVPDPRRARNVLIKQLHPTTARREIFQARRPIIGRPELLKLEGVGARRRIANVRLSLAISDSNA